jgi:transcription initiation factor TFIIB
MKSNNPFKEDEPETAGTCCDNPNILLNNGNFVCHNCGVVAGKELVSHEKRAYTSQEVNDRRRTEPTWRTFGPRTLIGISAPDSKGNHLLPRRQAMFNRLSKIQGSLINSLERNFWEAKPKLVALARKLNIPEYVSETAWSIYSEVAKQKLTMGRSIEAFTTASLYASIRIHNFPKLLEEITEVALLPLRSVHRSLALIVRKVLPQLKLKYKPIGPAPLIYRFGADLDLSIGVQKRAFELLSKARQKGLSTMGKDPKGISCAVLYLAAKSTPERMTQTRIAEVGHITEVTLRTRAKQVKQLLKEEFRRKNGQDDDDDI